MTNLETSLNRLVNLLQLDKNLNTCFTKPDIRKLYNDEYPAHTSDNIEKFFKDKKKFKILNSNIQKDELYIINKLKPIGGKDKFDWYRVIKAGTENNKLFIPSNMMIADTDSVMSSVQSPKLNGHDQDNECKSDNDQGGWKGRSASPSPFKLHIPANHSMLLDSNIENIHDIDITTAAKQLITTNNKRKQPSPKTNIIESKEGSTKGATKTIRQLLLEHKFFHNRIFSFQDIIQYCEENNITANNNQRIIISSIYASLSKMYVIRHNEGVFKDNNMKICVCKSTERKTRCFYITTLDAEIPKDISNRFIDLSKEKTKKHKSKKSKKNNNTKKNKQSDDDDEEMNQESSDNDSNSLSVNTPDSSDENNNEEEENEEDVEEENEEESVSYKKCKKCINIMISMFQTHVNRKIVMECILKKHEQH